MLGSEKKRKVKAQVMTSLVKNIIAGVLAVAAILGVAALFVDVTRNKGDGGDGKLIQEGGRATWGRSLEERDGPMTESEKIVAVLRKNLDHRIELFCKGQLHGSLPIPLSTTGE